MRWNNWRISATIAFVALALTVPFLGDSRLFDWDEVNFAEAAREMIASGQYGYVQINFEPFWEKPPLFIWMQVLSMKLFGVNAFAARFPNAICGALSLVLLFNIGQRLVSTRFGVLWVLVYAGSFLSQFYFRSGIIDPWFNLFIFFGIHQLVLATETAQIGRVHLLVSALSVGLAVLTKGPTAFGLVGIAALTYLLARFRSHEWKLVDGISYGLVVIGVGFSYYLFELLRGHGYVIEQAIDYHLRLFAKSEAGHGEPFYYHPVVLLFGCFPMSLVFIAGWFVPKPGDKAVQRYRLWMNILFWVVLIVFSVVKTKIVHYSSLTYFPMSFLATLVLYHLAERERFPRVLSVVLAIFGVLFGVAFAVAGLLGTIKPWLLNVLAGNIYTESVLAQHVPDNKWQALIGFFLLVGMAVALYRIRSSVWNGTVILFCTTLLTTTVASIVLVPKADKYLQKALFDVYEEKSGQVYFKPLGYRTYADLFYGRKEANGDRRSEDIEWLLSADVDRPVLFVLRVQNLSMHQQWFPSLEVTQRLGGYVILERTDGNYPFLKTEDQTVSVAE
jgi:4-amino-4-deoxy-L-arabinose transferase-like glycosyltransferase